MPRDGMVAPFLRSSNLQTAVGLFTTCAMAVGILMILHGAADMPSYRIMQHTRHKSHEQVAGYIREDQK